MQKADIGLIGLAVMGQNLVLNMLDHNIRVSVYNRSSQKVDDLLERSTTQQQLLLTPNYDIASFCASLSSPKKIMLMVKAGEVVDDLIQQLLPFLEAGDVIIDGGNSLYSDTQRRADVLAAQHILFLGLGVSGGEEGARFGPSLMPGGHAQAWALVKDIYQVIAAKVDGQICCQWVGEGGAGHYVKMVHNGIEYGDMQLICEAYQLMRDGLGLSVDQIAEIFQQWNQGLLDSYLIEITHDVLCVKENSAPLVDKILDSAGQKGTGKWTAIDALEQGIPLTLIGEAVFARFLSSLKGERLHASQHLCGPEKPLVENTQAWIGVIHDALYAAKIISYAQGFMLMRQAAKTYAWKLAYGDIALMWRGGCIIRSRFLSDIKQAFEDNPQLNNLLLDDFFKQAIKQAQTGWRKAIVLGVEQGIPLPAMSSALAFYDGYRSENLPANLLQAQRDYFGAHTYERVDQPRGQFFHTDWIIQKNKVKQG
ncbi:MAG: decarboxylating NADP(+)-dependent phosphogluconate dehydrogenase [Gammaproteobacteria bacterium]|nr:decarboxylating NADP(+)-dependent phosphogluconate dehydrogenase [Gammaproteobacteria bacterium]